MVIRIVHCHCHCHCSHTLKHTVMNWDMNLTNDSSESFAPCYSQSVLLADFTQNHTHSSFKTPHKIFRETARVYSWIAFCRTEKPDKKTQVYAQKARLKTVVQEFYLRNTKGDHTLFCCRWKGLNPNPLFPCRYNNVMLSHFHLF
jgi:hypothetical protein